MKTGVLTAAVPLIFLSLATAFLSIGPRPQDGVLTAAEAHGFRPRSDIIDVPQVPPPFQTTDTCRALVLLVDFQDKPAEMDTSALRSMLFGDGQGSMRAYFEENSYGRFSVAGDICGWFRSACKHRDIVNRDHYFFRHSLHSISFEG